MLEGVDTRGHCHNIVPYPVSWDMASSGSGNYLAARLNEWDKGQVRAGPQNFLELALMQIACRESLPHLAPFRFIRLRATELLVSVENFGRNKLGFVRFGEFW